MVNNPGFVASRTGEGQVLYLRVRIDCITGSNLVTLKYMIHI